MPCRKARHRSSSARRAIRVRILLFVLPLLARPPKGGVLSLGSDDANALRNGADAWVRLAYLLSVCRFSELPPMVLVLLMAAWNYGDQADKPGDLVGVLTGMALESADRAALKIDEIIRCLTTRRYCCRWNFPRRKPQCVRS